MVFTEGDTSSDEKELEINETFDDMLHRHATEMAEAGATQFDIDMYIRDQEFKMKQNIDALFNPNLIDP